MDIEDKEKKLRYFRRDIVRLRKLLLEKHNHTCVSCGITDEVVPLELAHIIPVSSGGETSEENLTLLCPNCHNSFDRQPREYEFVSFLSELLRNNPSYTHVQQEPLLGRETRYRADLIVDRLRQHESETLLIECKSYLATNVSRLKNIISQLQTYREVYGDCRMVLAIPASFQKRDLLVFNSSNIEIWDLSYIAHEFSKQLDDATPGYYKTLLLTYSARPSKETREQELLNSLSSCAPGKADCYVYQSLVGDILEHLFTPPLGKPIPELSDKSLANRRDFIMPNYTDKGFWAFMREKYGADYIVIDAKNYTRKVRKSEVLQVANYLKPHGAGLFGLIVSRKGGDASGCEHTLREQWLVNQKMIIVLDDEDIIAMLMAKSDGRLPEDVLGQKIERFRLSM